MRVAALILLSLPLFAQSNGGGGAIPGKFDSSKWGDITPKPYHIHAMFKNCKGQPDAVYGRADGVYYACMHGKEVCSKESGAIPKPMMTAYDAVMRESEAKQKEYRAKLVREGRALSEDPQEDLKLQV